jgi:hypothetical protein
MTELTSLEAATRLNTLLVEVMKFRVGAPYLHWRPLDWMSPRGTFK